MADTPIPWIGLAALVAMFIVPFLPDWLFQGPRTIKHWRCRHVCGYCDAPWTDGHNCSLETSPMAHSRLEGRLRRLNHASRSLTPRSTAAVPELDDKQ